MGYCCYMTRAGYALQAKLFAEGGNLHITRVMVGAGTRPEGTPPAELADLAAPMAQATSTKPVRTGCDVSLIIEYRSDFSPNLETPFQIKEFGVFATGVDGDEVLVLWADMTTCPDTAVPQKYGGCVRRWPVNITIGPDASVSLAYPAGAWLTREEAEAVIKEGLEKGLDMGDGTTVPQAVAAMGEDLELVKKAVNNSSFYRVFEPFEWTVLEDGMAELRIPASEHGMAPRQEPLVSTLRQRLGRTAFEYDEDTAAPLAGLLIAAMKAALADNTEAPGTWPTAEDGHVILTWEQVQYLLLESTSVEDEGQTIWTVALVSADEAADQAAALGFNWRERDNGAEETVTLDALLTAAYMPAMGIPSNSFESMVTLGAIRGLRFRRGMDGDGYAAKYDLDGRFSATWGTTGSEIVWDLGTRDLVVRHSAPFPGDLLILDRADTGSSERKD